MKPSTIAVIRDTNSGAAYLVPAESHESFDIDRLDEMGWELSGWLQHPQQFKNVDWSEESDTEESDDDGLGYDFKPVYFGPMFTECSRDDCSKQIVISEEGGAPEFCTDHEEE